MTDSRPSQDKLDQLIAAQKDYAAKREQGYRERALKLFPWICGRCGREFTRANLRELTVHHVDHNHDNNPADGSNWELLCLYCHDEEHTKFENRVRYGDASGGQRQAATHQPFANLREALKGNKTNDN